MGTFAILLRRDLAILLPGGARGSAFLPLIFFLLVAVLFPFAVGPEPSLLARTGGGVLWVAALLASILPLDRLVAADREAGLFDQLALRGISEEVAMTARLVAHWLTFGPLILRWQTERAIPRRAKIMAVTMIPTIRTKRAMIGMLTDSIRKSMRWPSRE